MSATLAWWRQASTWFDIWAGINRLSCVVSYFFFWHQLLLKMSGRLALTSITMILPGATSFDLLAYCISSAASCPSLLDFLLFCYITMIVLLQFFKSFLFEVISLPVKIVKAIKFPPMFLNLNANGHLGCPSPQWWWRFHLSWECFYTFFQLCLVPE